MKHQISIQLSAVSIQLVEIVANARPEAVRFFLLQLNELKADR